MAEENEHFGMRTTEPLFENIDGSQAITEIESLCMNCNENGITKLLLTKIPHFKEVVIMAFECPHCGFKNNEIQSASAVAVHGMRQTCAIRNQKDLSRQVVKSEYATVRFEELDFEIPPNSQRGILSTYVRLTSVDGILDRAMEGLKQDQEVRKEQHPELYVQIEKIIEKLQEYYDNKKEFTISIDDPTGNSYIENLQAPNKDPQMTIQFYDRTKEQREAIGLPVEEEPVEEFPLEEQVHVFPGNCSRCNAPSETRMHMLDIPHFKEVIIMATDCDLCGYKSNEVKAGGAISPTGQKITLIMTDTEDLSRDILKSESCGLAIPEIGLELATGTLGGRFTTVEGLLTQVFEELEGRSQFMMGDSSQSDSKTKFTGFLGKLKQVLDGELFPITLILNDPLANSHLQNLYAPDPDPNMTIEEYQRSYEDNETWGLNDIQTENYEQPQE
jgi:zinc finger protein